MAPCSIVHREGTAQMIYRTEQQASLIAGEVNGFNIRGYIALHIMEHFIYYVGLCLRADPTWRLSASEY